MAIRPGVAESSPKITTSSVEPSFAEYPAMSFASVTPTSCAVYPLPCASVSLPPERRSRLSRESAKGSGISTPETAQATNARCPLFPCRPMSHRSALCAFCVTSKPTPQASSAVIKRPRKVKPDVSLEEISFALSPLFRIFAGCWSARNASFPVTKQSPFTNFRLAWYPAQLSHTDGLDHRADWGSQGTSTEKRAKAFACPPSP